VCGYYYDKHRWTHQILLQLDFSCVRLCVAVRIAFHSLVEVVAPLQLERFVPSLLLSRDESADSIHVVREALLRWPVGLVFTQYSASLSCRFLVATRQAGVRDRDYVYLQ
jgi:hypothetical protein